MFPKQRITIAGLYTAFAIFSSVINIGSQMVFLAVYTERYAIEISILFGTLMRLLPRYILEKNYVFVSGDKRVAV